MKTLLLFILSIPIFAQATFPVQIPSESAVSVTISAQAVSSATLFIKSETMGIPATTTNGSTLIGATSIVLTSSAGITTGMGLLIGTEVCLVTGVSGNTMTVTRATLGTSAAAYSTLQPVTILRSGSYSVWLANLISDHIRQSMTIAPATTIAAQNAAIATAQATIQTTVNAAVSHVP